MVAAQIAGQPLAPAPVAVGAVSASTDLLYLQPAPGLTTAHLIRGLGELGLDVVDSSHQEGVRVRVSDAGGAEALAARLADSGLVRSVEADVLVSAARTPNDPGYVVSQYAYLETVRAPEAWEMQTGHDGIVIAIVDTGVDYTHPDLRSQLYENRAERFDGRDEDENGCADDFSGCNFVSLATADPSCGYTQGPPHWRAMDDEGHGTFVAGLAAADGDNEIGIAGIAWDARILPVKVLDCTATGRISDAAAGIRYAARSGADVINISFGTQTDSPALREAVEFARASGSIVVASAGNDGRRGLTYPARYDGVISVAASGLLRFNGIDYQATAPFANFGGSVDFLAPGVSVLSTVPERLCGQDGWNCSDGPYASGNGSSFATPIVAGAVALVRAQHPELSPDFIVQLLLATRSAGATVADSPVLDIAAAVGRPIFSGGIPGISRDGGGDEIAPGPAAN